jgi:hypothetical protein
MRTYLLGCGRRRQNAASLALLEGLHGRFVLLLRSLSDADFARTFWCPGFG